MVVLDRFELATIDAYVSHTLVARSTPEAPFSVVRRAAQEFRPAA